MDKSKMYVVVEFLFKGTNYVSAAPKKWIKGSQCLWPKKDKESKAIKEGQDPTEEWNTIENVSVLGEYSTFKEARYFEQRFARTDDESSEGSQKDNVQNERMKRNSKPNTRYRDPSVSPPPSITPSASFSEHSSTDDEGRREDREEDEYINSSNREDTLVSVRQGMETFEDLVNKAPIIIESSNDQMEGIKQILETVSLINEKIEIIENRISNIENILNTSFSVNPQRAQNLVSKLLPLKSLNNLQELELQLADEDKKQQLLQVLQYVGGSSERACVARCLERLFTNQCAMFCSWTGKKDNFKLKDLISIQILRDAVRHTYPALKDDVFEKSVMTWLQFAKTRFDRGKE